MKKQYVRPDIREESQILTVRAWVTKTQYVVATPTTTTSYTLQRASTAVTTTSQALLHTATSVNYLVQRIITNTAYGLQNALARLTNRRAR